MRKIAPFVAAVVLAGSGGPTAVHAADAPRHVARLPQGTVRLVGVVRGLPHDHARWWDPDGSPADLERYRPFRDHECWTRHAPEKRVTFLLHIECQLVDASSAQRAAPPGRPGDEEPEEYVSASDEPLPDSMGPSQKPGNERREMDVSWPAWGLDGAVPPSVRPWEGHSVLDPRGRLVPDYKMFSASLAPSIETADFGVGVSAGIWETVITQKPGSDELSEFHRDGRQWFVKIHKATPAAPANSTEVKVVIAHREFYGRLYTRLVAVTTDGREQASLIAYQGNNGSAVFRNLPVSSISELRFQVRPYDWVEFKNVSLHPGKKTQVDVVSFRESVILEE